MTKASILSVILLNLFMLLVIMLIVFIIKSRQPMTAKRLRREIEKKLNATCENPFQDDFCKTRMMLAVIDDYVPHERTIASIFIYWWQNGFIKLETTPKKRLKSFGNQDQPSIIFNFENIKTTDAAEKLLYETLYSFADETSMLQKSELYQISRDNSSIIFQRIEQFISQGKHSLRASGQMQQEKKRRHFGFLDEQRQLFTEKGVRQAAELKSYQLWLKEQTELEPKFWRDAVLLDASNGIYDKNILYIADILAKTIISGATSGKQSKK